MNYSIDDQHGTNICGGLSEHNARRVAQDYANRLGAPVLLYVDGTDEHNEVVRPDAEDLS